MLMFRFIASRRSLVSPAFAARLTPRHRQRRRFSPQASSAPLPPTVVQPPDEDARLVIDADTDNSGDTSVKAALKNGSLGFGFSAGGLLFSYYVGVLDELKALRIIDENTQLAGSSAGSLIAACHHSGLPLDIVLEGCWQLARDCRTNGTRGRLGTVLKATLEELLPDDIHERCHKKLWVAITKAFPRPTGVLISEFHDKDDVIACLLTSCHIPWWFDNSVLTRFRGALHYDGGLSNFIPLPPTVQKGIRVCCFPARQLATRLQIQISPDSFGGDEPVSLRQLMQWAFEPAEEEVLVSLVDQGRKDARAWAEANGVLNGATGSPQMWQASGRGSESGGIRA